MTFDETPALSVAECRVSVPIERETAQKTLRQNSIELFVNISHVLLLANPNDSTIASICTLGESFGPSVSHKRLSVIMLRVTLFTRVRLVRYDVEMLVCSFSRAGLDFTKWSVSGARGGVAKLTGSQVPGATAMLAKR